MEPTTYTNLLVLLGYAGYFFGAVIGIFNATARTRRRQNDQLTQDLISNLTATVNQQKDALAELTKKFDAQNQEFHRVIGRNEVLEKILTGRDPVQEQVFKEAPKIFAVAKANHVLSEANNQLLIQLTTTLNDFVKTMSAIHNPSSDR